MADHVAGLANAPRNARSSAADEVRHIAGMGRYHNVRRAPMAPRAARHLMRACKVVELAPKDLEVFTSPFVPLRPERGPRPVKSSDVVYDG